MKFWLYVGIPAAIIGAVAALHYSDTAGDAFLLFCLLTALYAYLDYRTKQRESLRKEEGQIIGFFTALALDEAFGSVIADDILNYSLRELYNLRTLEKANFSALNDNPLYGKDYPEFCLLCIEKFVKEQGSFSQKIDQQLLDFCEKHRNEVRHLTYYTHERR